MLRGVSEGGQGGQLPPPPFGRIEGAAALLLAPPHYAWNRALRGHFPRNQDARVKLKSELISSKF